MNQSLYYKWGPYIGIISENAIWRALTFKILGNNQNLDIANFKGP
jgi:hypothetical protein